MSGALNHRIVFFFFLSFGRVSGRNYVETKPPKYQNTKMGPGRCVVRPDRTEPHVIYDACDPPGVAGYSFCLGRLCISVAQEPKGEPDRLTVQGNVKKLRHCRRDIDQMTASRRGRIQGPPMHLNQLWGLLLRSQPASCEAGERSLYPIHPQCSEAVFWTYGKYSANKM
ncbi:hypothetical protein F4804DRAFT_320307 [Jackrogersella minutella]|nr:hypothetical protein F4804DRAFT_320307 [Jackrogersella minutella]